MDAIIHFFENIPSQYRTVILASGFVLMWMVESIIPLFKNRASKAGHTGVNLFFTLTTLIVNFIFALLLVKASDFTTQNHFGLLYLVNLPWWLHAIAGIMILDLIGAYLIHLLEHKVKWMWKFHIIHHTDPHVNTTTALRHHPGESVFRALFTIMAVLIAGVPVWIVMLYQTLSAFLSQFNHANIRLPRMIDRTIRLLFVSPDMHKVHHHYMMPTTDTNYGNIFSLWDRVFGTYVKKEVTELHYGLDIYPEKEAHSYLPRLLRIPFEKYRAPTGSKFGVVNNESEEGSLSDKTVIAKSQN